MKTATGDKNKDKGVDKEVALAFVRLFPKQHVISEYQHSFFL